MNRRVLAVISLLLVASMVSACSGTAAPKTSDAPSASPQSAAPKAAGAEAKSQIVIAQSRDIESLDPAFYSSRQAANVTRLIYDALVASDDNMKIGPDLAESWQTLNDRTWRFKLRQNVTFHNGKKFTAADVKFSIERLNDPATKSKRTSAQAVKEVRVVDQHTVDLITQTAYAPLLTKLVNVEIMSAETFKEIGADGYGAKPVGTGPYTLTEWVKGERVVLQANPSYWRGAPKTGRVVIVPIPETATRIAALESGSIDIAAELPAQFSQQARGGTKAIDAPGTRVFYVGLNVAQKPFSDLRVRQALNYGVNVAQLVKELLNGQAEVLKGPLFQRVFGFSDAVQGYQYDPQKAKALLSEAGYAGGFEATLDVAPTFKAMAEAIAGQLQPLGVKIKVNVLETAALYDKYEPGNSQMYLSSWGNSEADADATLATQLLSTRKVKYTNYANPEVDPLITAAASTVDPQERQKLYKSALEIVVRDAPWIFLYSPTETYGARDQVDGWKPRPDGRFNLLNVSVK